MLSVDGTLIARQ